ncbi:MAG TPA: ABC transporter permease [Bryobacteraceae bacterium]|nr:ABC transporter permease [Bryobacteraceae bacterium]
MGTLLQDVRYGLRVLWKSPGFATVVILTLALGIGANTAIFSIVDAVLLRSLPFRDAGQLVRVVDNLPGVGLKDVGMSVPEFLDYDQRSGLFDQISATWPVSANLTGSDQPARIELLAVSPNYFAMLGAKAQIGRVFGPEDQAAGFAEAVVISDGLWRRAFGGDPKVLGRKLRADNDVYVVVGVMPPEFRHPGPTTATDVDLWGTAGFVGLPFASPPDRNRNMLPGAIGRLKAGLSLAQAQAKLDGFTTGLREQFPRSYRPEGKWSVTLEPLQEAVVGKARPLLLVLLGAVAMMLIVGCVNIANLLLSRASGRQREVAVRQALGAARFRLIRQLLTESVLLSLIAGVVGVAASAGMLRMLLGLVPAKIPRLVEVGIDARVLLFSLAVSIVTGILFGLAPALEASRISLADHLKESSRGSGGKRQNRTRGLLVVSEVALCLVLMIGAGLLVQSFRKLTQIDPGFDPRGVLVSRIWLPVPNDPKTDVYATRDNRSTFVREVLRRTRTIAGVQHVAMSTSAPLARDAGQGPITIEGRPNLNEVTLAEVISVSPEYFTVMGARLMEGRALAETDQPGVPDAVVVDRTTAARYWPGESPIGKRLKLGRPQNQSPWANVVGVVADIRHDGMDVDGVPHVYWSIYQRVGKALAVILRTAGDPATFGEAARREVQAVDPTLPVFGVRTLNEAVEVSLAQQRFSAQIMGAFAVLALGLAAIGIYGVLAYTVGQRTREIGIRMALGARGSEVVGMVLWHGMRLILIGAAVGIAGALALSRLLSRLIYGVSTSDPLVFTVVPLVLIGVAFIASYVPAMRATRIDPIEALRAE